jgi:hypothetical protein
MSHGYGVAGSAVSGNAYRFHCPTVERDARFIVCAFKKNRHWRGENFLDQDCRLAMRAGKCPVVEMMKAEYRAQDRLFFETESKSVHKLPTEIAEHMARIVVVPSHAAGLHLTPEQLEKHLGPNAKERVAGVVPFALPVEDADATLIAEEPKHRRSPKKSEVLDHLAGGDMASAINEAVNI